MKNLALLLCMFVLGCGSTQSQTPPPDTGAGTEQSASATPAPATAPTVHIHTAGDAAFLANSYLIETAQGGEQAYLTPRLGGCHPLSAVLTYPTSA